MKEKTANENLAESSNRNGDRSTFPDHQTAMMNQMYGGMYPTMSSYTHNDMLAMQYAYMYNSYLQQSMLAQMHSSTVPQSYFGNLNQSYSNDANKTSSKTEGKIDNAKYQAKSSSPKDNVRFDPYRRKSTSAPVSPNSTISIPSNSASPLINNVNSNAAITCGQTWHRPMRYSSSDNVNAASEKPVDLSQKTQKLQFLSTLKELIDAKDKEDTTIRKPANSNSVLPKACHLSSAEGQRPSIDKDSKDSDIKGTPFSDNLETPDNYDQYTPKNAMETKLSPKSEKSDTHTKALKTAEDKHAYIAVLRELFEKGHSRTSEKILATKSTPHSNLKTTHFTPSTIQDRTGDENQQTSVNTTTQTKHHVNKIKSETCVVSSSSELSKTIKKDTHENEDTSLDNAPSQNDECLDEMSIEQSLVVKTEKDKSENKNYTEL